MIPYIFAFLFNKIFNRGSKADERYPADEESNSRRAPAFRLFGLLLLIVAFGLMAILYYASGGR